MATLPQLIEEDVQQLERALQDLLTQSEATTALIIDKGGFLICNHGEADEVDLTTIAALALGAYLANQTHRRFRPQGRISTAAFISKARSTACSSSTWMNTASWC